MKLPNVILAGSQKCATSSLFEIIASHPQCQGSFPKEPTFFSLGSNLADLSPYAACFDFANNSPQTGSPVRMNPKVVFEGSTSYMAETYVPERIATALGEAVKFIFILRRPAKRVVSAYWHVHKRGDERRPIEEVFADLPADLNAACDLERQRIDQAIRSGHISLGRYADRYDNPAWSFAYLANSRYSQQLQRFEDSFSRDNLCVLILEECLAQPARVFKQLADFLEIDANGFPERFSLKSNATKLSRTPPLHKPVQRLATTRWGRTLRRRFSLVDSAYTKYTWKPPPPIPPEIEQPLTELMSSETQQLSAWLGRNLQQWGW